MGTIFSTLSMRSLVCLLCLCLVLAVTGDSAHAQAQPRVARLTRLGCSLDQVIMCSGEIEAAWSQCWDNTASWFDCIQGTSDCALCVCDVVEWLGPRPVRVSQFLKKPL